MVQAPHRPSSLATDALHPDFAKDLGDSANLEFQLPAAEDESISEAEFERKVELAWQVCDRFDLQTDIWRGRILRTVRDRESRRGNGQGVGFLNWLRDREISKTQAYSLIELAESADMLLHDGLLEADEVNQFSKRAFVETAQASPEVQQLVCELARESYATEGQKITRREVRQLTDEWTAMSSDLLPEEIRQKAADRSIPTRYLSPLVREMEKLPESHQTVLKAEVAENPDVDTVKQVTAEAKYLAKYLTAAKQVQTIDPDSFDLEGALEEALRVGCLNSTADLVNQAAQLEQLIAKLFTTWKRLNTLSERVYLDSGASTPKLRSLLDQLSPLSSQLLELQLGDRDSAFSRPIRLQILTDEAEA